MPLGAGPNGETPKPAVHGPLAAAVHGQHVGNDSDSPSRPSMAPQEHMLVGMAKALNLELGHWSRGAGRESSTSSSPDRSLPPEDSFERFLLDMQADLRVVSTEPSAQGA
jgi:hypothetical protein